MAEDGGPREGKAHLVVINTAKETDGLCGTSCSSVASKACCAVYSTDGTQFEVPLAFLGPAVFGELLRMSQEEFGFMGSDSSKITLPCDATIMGYTMCLLSRSSSTEMEAAFLSSMVITLPCQYDASHVVPRLGVGQHVALCSS